jgi:hypothetical protein
MGTDAAVANDFLFLLAFKIGIDVVESLSGGVTVVGDFSLVGIGPQSVGMKAQGLGSFSAR